MKFATTLSIVVLLGISCSKAQANSSAAGLTGPTGTTTVVDCGKGQSLNAALASMQKDGPATVLVKGTCTEYVRVVGFEDLTLEGMPGAALVQPNTVPGGGLLVFVLYVQAARSVTIGGLAIHSQSSAAAGIGIGQGSLDVRLRNMTIDGAATFDVEVFERSQVSLAYVTARDPGYSPIGVYDVSDVHIEHCLFENTTGAAWHAGLDVGTGHVTMYATTIRNMQVGINVGVNAIVDIGAFDTYYALNGSTDVVIENSFGTNYWGASIGSGGSLNVISAKLRIINPGQSYGGESAGVYLTGGGTLNANANLIISGSQGQGVLVSNNSFATLTGSSITGGSHGGLVAVNLSTIAVEQSNPLTLIGGNAPDLFCDSKSQISGGANLAGVPTVNCANLLPGDSVNLP